MSYEVRAIFRGQMIRFRFVCAAVLVLLLVPLSAAAAPNDPAYRSQWGMLTIGAEAAWPKGTGKGIVVAVVDTGVDLSHEDLAVPGKLIVGRDFIDGDDNPQDENGHGTHVAGISAAATFNGKGVAGVAPDAKIMVVRVLSAFGINVSITNPRELLVNTAKGVRWAADHGADVINMSFGAVAGEGPGDALAEAIEYAWSKGAICVVAAGNDSGESSGFTTENAVVVAATQRDDRLASYSNHPDEAKWGIAAPGSDVLSTYYTYPLDRHNEYEELSGTSMAAPHVSGALAVLRSMGLTPIQAIDRLMATAEDLGPRGRDPSFGAGRLELEKAAGAATTGGGTAVSGSGSGGGSGGGSKSGSGASKQTGAAAAQKVSPGSSLADYKDPEPGSVSIEETKEGLSPKTLLNIGIAVVLIGAGIGWYLWFRRRAAPEE